MSHPNPVRRHPTMLGLAAAVALAVTLQQGPTIAAEPATARATTPSTASTKTTAAAGAPTTATRQTRPRVPRHLLHRTFKRATPNRWCAQHRTTCVRALRHRLHTFLVRHPGHRTRWGTAANRRGWHHRYVRAWRHRYGAGGCTHSSCTKRQTRSLAQDWSRFSRRVSAGHSCQMTWMPTYRSPQFPDDPFYGIDCRPHVTSLGRFGRDDKFFVVCSAIALTVSGVGAAGSVLTAGASVPAVLWGLGAEGSGCAVGWGFLHFLNWP